MEEFRQEVERYSGLGTLYGLYRADPWSGKDFTPGLDGALAPKARNQVQRYVLEHSRLRIPVLMSTECPHGHQALDGYLLPVNLAAGSPPSPRLPWRLPPKLPGSSCGRWGWTWRWCPRWTSSGTPVGDAVRSASARIRSWPPVWPRRLSGDSESGGGCGGQAPVRPGRDHWRSQCQRGPDWSPGAAGNSSAAGEGLRGGGCIRRNGSLQRNRRSVLPCQPMAPHGFAPGGIRIPGHCDVRRRGH